MALDTTINYTDTNLDTDTDALHLRTSRSYEGDVDCGRCAAVVPHHHRVGDRQWHILSTSRRNHFHQVTLGERGNTVSQCSCEHGYYAGLRGQEARCVHVEIARTLQAEFAFGPLWRWRSRPGDEGVELFAGDELPVRPVTPVASITAKREAARQIA